MSDYSLLDFLKNLNNSEKLMDILNHHLAAKLTKKDPEEIKIIEKEVFDAFNKFLSNPDTREFILNFRLNGESWLMIALRKNNQEIARLLIKNGANLQVVSPTGKSSLSYAIIGGFPDIVKKCLETQNYELLNTKPEMLDEKSWMSSFVTFHANLKDKAAYAEIFKMLLNNPVMRNDTKYHYTWILMNYGFYLAKLGDNSLLELAFETGLLSPLERGADGRSSLIDNARHFGLTSTIKLLEDYKKQYEESIKEKVLSSHSKPEELEKYEIAKNSVKIQYFIMDKGHTLGLSHNIRYVDPLTQTVRVQKTEGNFYHPALQHASYLLDQYHKKLIEKGNRNEQALFFGDIKDAMHAILEDSISGIQKAHERIAGGELTFLQAGWAGHGFAIAIYGNYLIVCNRGQRKYSSDPKIMIYLLTPENKKKLTEPFIASLKEVQNIDPSIVLNRLAEVANPLNFLESIDAKEQAHGNCTDANFKSINKAILYLRKREVMAKEANKPESDLQIKKLALQWAIEAYKDFTKDRRDQDIDDIISEYNGNRIPKNVLDQLATLYLVERLFKPSKKTGKLALELNRVLRLLKAMTPECRKAVLSTSPESLVLALESNDKEMIEYLVKEGCKDYYGALFRLIERNADPEAIKRCIALGNIQPSKKLLNENEQTPLMTACIKGNIGIIMTLLEAGFKDGNMLHGG